MFTCFCSFVLYPTAQRWDVRGIEGLTQPVHRDLLSLSLCHVTMLLHKRHTCLHNMLAGAIPQVLEFQGIWGLPYKIPNEIPNALSCPLPNRKQAST